MTDNKRFEIMNTLMRMNRKMAARGPKQGGPQFGRGQIMMIKEILGNPGISQDQLAQKLSIDKTTVAKTIKKLEEHDMVIRTKSNEDSRKYEITATEKASKIRDRVKDEFEKRSIAIFAGIAEDDLDSFSETLKKIEKNIEKNKENSIMDKKRTAMVITRAVIHKPGITKEDLLVQTDIGKRHMEKILERIHDRGLIKFEGDQIYPTEKALEMKEKMKGRRPGGHGGRAHLRRMR